MIQSRRPIFDTHPITRAQRKAIAKLWHRDEDGAYSYRAFRKRFQYSYTMGCLLGRWCGMTIGIEADGYTHS